jgi:uncharacterized protein (TIGR02246 family)
MTSHALKKVIEDGDRAIAAEDFDAIPEFYTDDAILVLKPGLHATGKQQIRQAFVRIAEYFNHSLSAKQGNMIVLEGGSTALVISETVLAYIDKQGTHKSEVRYATYVFTKGEDGKWLCVIDNSYGTDLLRVEHQ